MTKRAFGFATLCLAFAFAPQAASAQSLSPTLQKIKEAGTITIGHRDSSVPFSYLDDSQKPIGFSLELCDLVVAKIKAKLGQPGLKVAYQAVNSSNRIPLVKNGTVDIECGSTANTIARQQEVSYSVIFYAPQFKWIALKSSDLKTTDDLKGKAVVVTQGTNTAQFVAKLNAAAVAALADAGVRQRLGELGEDIPPRAQQTPQALGAFHRSEIDKWWPIIKAAGIKPE